MTETELNERIAELQENDSEAIHQRQKVRRRIPVHGHRGNVEYDGSKMSDWGKKK